MEEAEKTLYPNLYAERKQRGLVYGLKNAVESTQRKTRRAQRKQQLEERGSLAATAPGGPRNTRTRQSRAGARQQQQQLQQPQPLQQQQQQALWSAQAGQEAGPTQAVGTRESVASRFGHRRNSLPTFMLIDRDRSFKNLDAVLAERIEESIGTTGVVEVGAAATCEQDQVQGGSPSPSPSPSPAKKRPDPIIATKHPRNQVIRGDVDVQVDEQILWSRPFTSSDTLQQLQLGEVNFCSRPRTRYTRRDVSKPMGKLQQLLTSMTAFGADGSGQGDTGNSLRECHSMPILHGNSSSLSSSASSSSTGQDPAMSPPEPTTNEAASIALLNRLVRGPSRSRLAPAAIASPDPSAPTQQSPQQPQQPYHQDFPEPSMVFITEVDTKVPPIQHQHFPTCLAHGAVSLYALEQFDQAVCWFQRALEVVRTNCGVARDDPRINTSNNHHHHNNMSGLAHDEQTAALEALCLHQLGLAYKEAHQLDLAMQMQKKCIRKAKLATDPLLQARGHKALGVCYLDLHDFKLALHHQRKALSLATCAPMVLANSDQNQTTRKDSSKSMAHGASANPSIPTSSHCRSRKTRQPKDLELEARIYANFGNLASGQNRFLDAFAFYNMDLKLSRHLDNCIGQSRAHKNLFILYGKMNQQLKQRAHGNKATALAVNGFEQDVCKWPLKVSGNLYLQMTRWNPPVAQQVHHALLTAFQQLRPQLDAKARQQLQQQPPQPLDADDETRATTDHPAPVPMNPVYQHARSPHYNHTQHDQEQELDYGTQPRLFELDRDHDTDCCQHEQDQTELAKLVATMSAELHGPFDHPTEQTQ